MTAAEEAREELLEAMIDLVVGVLEASAGLAIDLADGGLQGLEGARDVGVLLVQIDLALLLLIELLDGRQVDGA